MLPPNLVKSLRTPATVAAVAAHRDRRREGRWGMVDIVHARDEYPASGATPPRADRGAGSGTTRRRRQDAPPRSDIGTLAIHWLTAIAFFVSVFTGVRIAADDPDASVSKWLTPILPQGEVWTWHFFAGLTLFFGA